MGVGEEEEGEVGEEGVVAEEAAGSAEVMKEAVRTSVEGGSVMVSGGVVVGGV